MQSLADERLLGGRCGWILLVHDEHAGVVAERDTFALEGENDAAAKLAEHGILLVGADADVDGIDDLAAVDLVDAEDVGVGDGDLPEGRIVADLLGEAAEGGDDGVGVCAGVDADWKRGDGVVAGHVGDGGDLAVRDEVERAVAVAELGGAQGEIFDRALEAGDANDFTDVVLVFDEDEDAVEHVLEDALRTEADTDANDTGRGQQRGEIDVEDGQDVQQDDEADDTVGGGPDDGCHGAELGGALRVADLSLGQKIHALDEEVDDSLQDESKDENANETGQVGAEEVDDVVMPVALEDFGDAFVLRGWVEKAHDGVVSHFL